MIDDKQANAESEALSATLTVTEAAVERTRYANGILVLGMHRSGTSAVAGVLNMMGAYLGKPDDLLPPHPHDNPTGYWERTDVIAAHDAVLDANGYKWDRLAGLDPHRLKANSVATLHHSLHETLRELGKSGRPWLVKDPRLCLLLPQWLSLLESPACIVVVRDPREVAASMREGPRGAYTSHYLIALWEEYLRNVLTALRGRTVLFVDYASMLDDPATQCHRMLRGLAQIGVDTLQPPPVAKLTAFLNPHLRRSKPASHVPLPASQAALFKWLQEQCAATGPQVVDAIPADGSSDEVLHEYERAFAVQAERTRGETLAETHAREAEVEARLATSLQEMQRVQEALQVATSRLRELTRERDGLADQLADAVHQRNITAMELNETRHARNVAAGALDQTRHERNVAASGRIAAERHVRNLEKAVRDLHHSWSWKLTAPLRAVANLLSPRLPTNLEHALYRAYYALPGASPARKRAFVLWLHSHVGWITHNTLSYRLARQTTASPSGQPVAAGVARMDLDRANDIVAKLKNKPLLSIVMPVYNVERQWLLAAVDSVRRQYYPNWQLCVADDASTRQETRDALREIAALNDNRIKIVRLPKNAGIAVASNAALKLAAGEYVGLLDNDDELSLDALLEVALCINATQPDVIYSDEDKLDESGEHVEVHCKPDYSPDYFFSINYVCHFAVLRRSLLAQIGGFRAGYDGAQDYDLLLRATEKTDKIAHIAKVLYHWRRISGSTASSSAAKPQTTDAGRRAIADSMQRRAIDCAVETGPYPNTYRVRRKIIDTPLVSILVPFRDKADLLDTCVTSILDKTRYANYEVVCIDNGSQEETTRALLERLRARDKRLRIISHDVPFNYSAINNFAVSQAKGEHLLFLNNDTEVISEEWLDAMLEHSQRPEVGVVGARLWYADKTIQHAGVIVGPGGVAGHGHLFVPGDDPGYFARIRLVQNLSCVTFACAMTRRDVFEKLGGLNENDLRIAFNDVDYCLRAREAGLLVVYTPFALLYHYESKSRGYEDTPEKQIRFAAEIRYMQQRHKTIIEQGDPYYNPGLLLNNSFQPDPDYAAKLPR